MALPIALPLPLPLLLPLPIPLPIAILSFVVALSSCLLIINNVTCHLEMLLK